MSVQISDFYKNVREVKNKIVVPNSYNFEDYNITELDSGLRVISEKIPHFRSISLGFWIPVGSRNENLENNGITHLIEHLLFKGTKKRTYRDIAIAFDSMGAEFNAFTDKENSCVYADFIDTHLDQCLELLFDVVMNPSFLPENIKLERKVILEEIKMVKDNPSDDIFNYFYKIVFSGHPLSLPILGSTKSLKMLDNDEIDSYFRKNFKPDGIVLSAAGNIEHSQLVEKVRKNIEGVKSYKKKFPELKKPAAPSYKRKIKSYKSKTEAGHICIGGPGCGRTNADKYPLSLFTNILGGSMSSRLFQKIREEKGLSYSIFSSNTQYTDYGITVIYAATSTGNLNKVKDLIFREIEHVKKTGISFDEFEIARENIKGNIVLGVEDISSRMFRLGKALLMDNNVLTIDEILKKIDNVKIEQINDAASRYFQQDDLSAVIICKPSNGRLK